MKCANRALVRVWRFLSGQYVKWKSHRLYTLHFTFLGTICKMKIASTLHFTLYISVFGGLFRSTMNDRVENLRMRFKKNNFALGIESVRFSSSERILMGENPNALVKIRKVYLRRLIKRIVETKILLTARFCVGSCSGAKEWPLYHSKPSIKPNGYD